MADENIIWEARAERGRRTCKASWSAMKCATETSTPVMLEPKCFWGGYGYMFDYPPQKKTNVAMKWSYVWQPEKTWVFYQFSHLCTPLFPFFNTLFCLCFVFLCLQPIGRLWVSVRFAKSGAFRAAGWTQMVKAKAQTLQAILPGPQTGPQARVGCGNFVFSLRWYPFFGMPKGQPKGIVYLCWGRGVPQLGHFNQYLFHFCFSGGGVRIRWIV